MAQMLVNAIIDYAKNKGIPTEKYTNLVSSLTLIRNQIAPETHRIIQKYETNQKLKSIIENAIPTEGGHRGPFIYLASNNNGLEPNLTIGAASDLFYWADGGLDDVADKNTGRQGAESTRVKHGDAFALYASNVLYGIAMRAVIENLRDNPKKLEQIATSFAERLQITSRGQAIDMLMSESNLREVSFSDYFSLIEETTGFDIGNNLKVGGILADLDRSTIENLYQFGFHLGTLAQVRDDVLDYCKAKDAQGRYIIGKLPFRDIETGKKRLPLLITRDSNLRELPDRVYDRIESEFVAPRREKAREYLMNAQISPNSKKLLEEVLEFWSDVMLFKSLK